MNVSYNWLKEYVSFDMSAEKVAEILTFIGLEVEEINTVASKKSYCKIDYSIHVCNSPSNILFQTI